VYDEIEQQRTGDKEADTVENTARYQKAIEEMVRGASGAMVVDASQVPHPPGEWIAVVYE